MYIYYMQDTHMHLHAHTHRVSPSYLQVPHYGFNKLWIKIFPQRRKERVEYMEV